jgi:hypothetical protein
MLVDQAHRSARADGARVGRYRTEGDACERRLTGTVLADQRVNLARRDVEIYPVDGLDAGIPFADTAELERAAGVQVSRP